MILPLLWDQLSWHNPGRKPRQQTSGIKVGRSDEEVHYGALLHWQMTCNTCTWVVFHVQDFNGNWKGNHIEPMFVVRMLQIALMQIVLEVPDGPRKRKQNKIWTPKTNLKRHQLADVSESSVNGILMDRDIFIFDKSTKSRYTYTHSSAGRQRYQRMWRRCRQDLLILGWTCNE